MRLAFFETTMQKDSQTKDAADPLHINPDHLQQNNPSRLTWQLSFMVFSVSFGGWFPVGYAYGVTTPIQTIILHWIRAVKCSRLGIDPKAFKLIENQTLGLYENTTIHLWCKAVPESQEKWMLDFNTELNTIWAVTGSVVAAGAFISLWSTNFWLDRFGSRMTLVYNNSIGLAGALLCGLCVEGDSFEMFIIGRLLLGFNIGIVVSVVPLFCAEISPPNLRGAIGTVPSVMRVVGQLTTVVMGLPQLFGTTDLWPVVSWLRLVPCFYLFAVLPFCPESPRYLLLRRKDKLSARRALVWLRGTADVQDELTTIQKECEKAAHTKQTISILGIFTDPFLRKIMTTCLVCVFTMQLSGYAAVTTYTTDIFDRLRLSKLESLYGTVGVFLLQILGVFISMPLVDHAGRRFLMLFGLVGSSCCCFGIVGCSLLRSNGYEWAIYASLACVLSFILVFSVGPAFIPWVLVSEMFPVAARGSAMTLVSGGLHLVFVVCAFLFPFLHTLIGEWTFTIFGCCMVSGAFYIAVNLIETKGKTFAQIQTELREKL